MGRLLLLIAALIVLAAVVGLSFRAGRRLERDRKLADARAIDPSLHAGLEGFVRDVLAAPASLDTERMVVLPDATRRRGEDLMRQAAEGQAKPRGGRRRIGY